RRPDRPARTSRSRSARARARRRPRAGSSSRARSPRARSRPSSSDLRRDRPAPRSLWPLFACAISMPRVDSSAMKRRLALVALFALAVPFAAAAQYPSRPIKFIAPSPPGGPSDVLCRLLGAKLAEGLGQPVAVENRPGAAASIGHEYTAKQPPDGYTIVISSNSTLVNNLYLYKHRAFDVFTDFSP